MLVAVSSLDVAFASAIVAGVAAVASPWSAWAVTKLQLGDTKEQRTYGDRRQAYVEILNDLYKGEFLLEDCVDDLTNDRSKTALDILKALNVQLAESVEVEYKRAALISILGPEHVVGARRAFIDTWNAATDPLSHPERFQGTDEALRADAIKRLTDGLQTLEQPMEQLRIAIRDDLSS